VNPRTLSRTLRPVSASRWRIAVVASRFNEPITSSLADAAVECLRRHGSPIGPADVLWCPGAFELPLVAGRLARTGRWDAIICLGAVIRGETPHFEYVSSASAHGIQEVALRYGLPVVFGVLTTETLAQAKARAGGKRGNKGWDAALTAIDMIALLKQIGRTR
jgi:6,7-dimethyl-8-ribityllumazine synthase